MLVLLFRRYALGARRAYTGGSSCAGARADRHDIDALDRVASEVVDAPYRVRL